MRMNSIINHIFVIFFVFISNLFFNEQIYAQYQNADNMLVKGFENPPNAAKPMVWWRWMGTQVSKEGISRDMEALKRVGIGGVVFFQMDPNVKISDSKLLNSKLPNVKTLSDEWWALIQFAIKEAQRCGLDFTFQDCLGWSTNGGPWIKPEQSMLKIVSTETFLNQNELVIQLTKPKVDAKWNFYRDISVLAIKLHSDSTKQVFGDYTKDLTSLMDTNGIVKWTKPEGDWRLIRFGYTTTGNMQHPVSPEVNGLECDKMNKEALKTHFENYPARIIKEAGTLAGKTLSTILVDSYEAGEQNWTPQFAIEFKWRRGYELLKWLPVLNGYTVNSPDETKRFLADYKLTIAELFVDENYAAIGDLTHQYPNMKIELQPYNTPFNYLNGGVKADIPAGEFWHSNKVYGWWSLPLAASAGHIAGKQVIAAESYTTSPEFANWNTTPINLKAEGDLAYSKGINRYEIHVMAHQPWSSNFKPGMVAGPYGLQMNPNNTWWNQSKSWIDYLSRCQYLLQQGKFVADVCYLLGDGVKGYTLENGYCGDAISEQELINKITVKAGLLTTVSGMSYQVLILPNNTTISFSLAKKLKQLVADGAIVIAPKPIKNNSLTNYPSEDSKVKQIGQEVWGNCDGIKGFENTYGKGKVIWGKELKEVLADLKVSKDAEIDGVSNGNDIVWTHRKKEETDFYFFANQTEKYQTVNLSLRVNGKVPELWNAETGKVSDATIWEEKEGRTIIKLPFNPLQSWFIVFRKPSTIINNFVSCSSNASNLSVKNINGNQYLLATQNGTYSLITKRNKKIVQNVASIPNQIALDGSWQVDFPPNLGTPTSATFFTLSSWSENADNGIKYFSGTATYTKKLIITKEMLGADKLLYLDLGAVKDIAEVEVNGQLMATLWKPPFVLSIAEAVHEGENLLTIKVTNTWANRLIGDEQETEDIQWGKPTFTSDKEKLYRGRSLTAFPDWFIYQRPRPNKGRYTFTTWNYYRKEDRLLPSGLLGPVNLIMGRLIKLASN